MAVYKTTDGQWVASYGGEKVYTTSQSKALAAYNSMSGKTTTTKTTTSKSSLPPLEDTVARAKAMLGSAYDPNTQAPTAARLDEIASQSFISPEVKAGYEATKGSPINQDYMAAVYNAGLPKTTVPTNAGAIASPYQGYTAPTTSPGFGDISFATAGTQGAYAQMQQEAQAYFDNLKAQQEMFNAQAKDNQQSFLKSLISPQEAKQQAWEDTGIDVKNYYAQQERGFKEIESLTNEYNKTIEMKDTQIATTHDRLASNNFINNQIAQIERNAAPKLNRLSADINAKAAVLQALQGNFASAQQYVNQAVQDATAMNKYNYEIYEMNYNMNKDNFDRLGEIYTTAYTTKMSFLQMEYEQQLADKKAIGELLLQYPNAGIDIYNDDLNTAMQKAGVRAGTLEQMKLAQATSGGGVVEKPFSATDEQTLLGGGWTRADFQLLADDINTSGLPSVIENARAQGATQAQIDALYKTFGTTAPAKQFLTKDYFRSLFTEDQLKEAAKDAGFNQGGSWFFGLGVGEEGINKYLDSVMSSIDAYRQAGISDEEILMKMQK